MNKVKIFFFIVLIGLIPFIVGFLLLYFEKSRVLVSVILDCLAEGMGESEILIEYPSIKKEHIEAALHYGAILAREEVLPLTDSMGQISLKRLSH